MSLRTPLARVLGHGVARSGVHHWWMERLTAIALIPLLLWLLWALLTLPLGDYASVTRWIGYGFHPLWLSLAIMVMAWHSVLGVQMVLEDYVHSPGGRTAWTILSNFAHFAVAAAAIYAVLRIALRSA